MGVTSNRVDVKRAAGATERALERRAEPYAALFRRPTHGPAACSTWPGCEVVRNAAHDSICACSVDDVVDAVLHRFAEARQIADGIAGRGPAALGRSMAEPGSVVVNPSARARRGVVELVVGGRATRRRPTSRCSPSASACPGTMTLDANTVRTVLGMLQGPKIDDDAWVHDVRIEEDETGIDLTVAIGPDERPGVAIAEAKQDLYTRLGARPDVMVRVRLDQPPIRRIAARVAEVPGFGWRAFTPAPLAHPVVGHRPSHRPTAAGAVARRALANGLVTVAVDPTDGTFAVDGVAGFGRLVDGGDLGDSYNYSPPRRDTLGRHSRVGVGRRSATAGRSGPRAVVTATYRWPDHVDGTSQRRVGEHVGRRDDHRRGPRRRADRPGRRPPSSTRPATTACGSTCRSPSRPPSPWPSARSPPSARA